MKKKIFDLEEENARLTRELSRDVTRPVAERDGTISVLKHTINSLETQLQKAAATGGVLTDLTLLREVSGAGERTKHSVILDVTDLPVIALILVISAMTYNSVNRAILSLKVRCNVHKLITKVRSLNCLGRGQKIDHAHF